MLFMIIERFREGDAEAVYRRLDSEGRRMPDELEYLGSWVSADLGRCFQLVECDDVALVQEWVVAWRDLVEFEVVPVTEGAATAEAVSSATERE
ncbi:hypothetical protein C2R22_11430 [Salinigranum rubrum]|uniref:DUF3303 domain-containing protein n=1 Tax=Salinigranum rubrum TaxID=755307 RepID=A0A2I8VJV8_9EURY|nr:DUF3303 family protein [Salinigranum rubrum]AUV82184.1 hypothetical protein C2R22_11430 [Salinigranum rubrum]